MVTCKKLFGFRPCAFNKTKQIEISMIALQATSLDILTAACFGRGSTMLQSLHSPIEIVL
jgi:hypothetical protein